MFWTTFYSRQTENHNYKIMLMMKHKKEIINQNLQNTNLWRKFLHPALYHRKFLRKTRNTNDVVVALFYVYGIFRPSSKKFVIDVKIKSFFFVLFVPWKFMLFVSVHLKVQKFMFLSLLFMFFNVILLSFVL